MRLVQQRSLEKRIERSTLKRWRTKIRSEAGWTSSGHEAEQPAGCDESKVALDLNPILGGVAQERRGGCTSAARHSAKLVQQRSLEKRVEQRTLKKLSGLDLATKRDGRVHAMKQKNQNSLRHQARLRFRVLPKCDFSSVRRTVGLHPKGTACCCPYTTESCF